MSAYLFILSMQVFVSSYREIREISALTLAANKLPILLYANDTATTHTSVRSIQAAFTLFELFAPLSGLSLNRAKTLVLPLRPVHPPELDLIGCHVEHNAVKYLGAWLHCKDADDEYQRNFKNRADTYDCLLNRWRLRGLSLVGRNLIV